MSNSSIKATVLKGVAWALLEKLWMRFVTFVVTLVLARLLTPDDYGVVALLTIFTTIAAVIVDSGLGSALVQKKDASELDFNSVFYVSLILGGIAYFVLYELAPYIAAFYKSTELIAILRVTSIVLIFNAINSVQDAELSRKLLFNLSFRISAFATTMSAAVGITLALFGYGPWALVWQTVSNSFMGLVARWFIIAWRPKIMFSWKAVKGLFAFGWKLSVSSIIEVVFGNLSGLLIGKIYSRVDLSYVTKGQAIPNLVVNSLNGALGRVTFPLLARMQDSPDRIRETMRKVVRLSSFFVFPAMTGLAVCARSIVLILLGEQWMNCVPYVQLACFQFALWPFHTVNLQCIKAIGRSDLFLKLEIIKKTAALIVMLAVFRYGVLVFVAVTSLVLGPFSVIVNSWPNCKILGYSIRKQMADVISTICICAIMAIVCLGIEATGFLGVETLFSALMLFIIQFIAGSVVFLGLSVALKVKPACEIAALIYPYSLKRLPILIPVLRRLSEVA